MPTTHSSSGVLYPEHLPEFHRYLAPPELEHVFRWIWIPQWNLPAGTVSRQHVLPYPAANLVCDETTLTLVGPTTGSSVKELQGRGWSVGVLLRPAALGKIHKHPHLIQDTSTPFAAAELQTAISAAMSHAIGAPDDEAEIARESVAKIIAAWSNKHLSHFDDTALLANQMETLIATDREITRVEHLASHLHVSIRTVQRIAHRFVGLSPLAMIRRYRLQEAAQRLRDDPSLTIAQIASELGYADHAHLSTDFRRVLGESPQRYRDRA